MCLTISQKRSLFVGSEFDVAVTMNRDLINQLQNTMPNLRKQVLLPNTGHWLQQERPTEVNQLLIEFLAQTA